MTRLERIHQLPGRLRLRFLPPIPMAQAMDLQERLAGAWPALSFRQWGLGQGLVVRWAGAEPEPDLLDQIMDVVNGLEPHRRDWRNGLIEALMVLAILGWALPVLPGTPFFLLALALRPSGR